MQVNLQSNKRGKGGRFWYFTAKDGAVFSVRTLKRRTYAEFYQDKCSVCIPEKKPDTLKEDGLTITRLTLGGPRCKHAAWACDVVTETLKKELRDKRKGV